MSAGAETDIETRYDFGGDEFVYVELSAAMSLPVHFTSLAITRRLGEEAIPGVEEICPSNASYMVRVDPDRLHPRDLVRELQRIEGGPVPIGPPTGDASPVAQTAAGTVVAQTVPDSAAAPAPDTRDPNQLYTDSIKTALIDAMLNYSGPMQLAADEWLTIAARDSDGPLMPGAVDDASTIVLRVKGSDIADFLAKRITPEEARKRVQVKEF